MSRRNVGRHQKIGQTMLRKLEEGIDSNKPDQGNIEKEVYAQQWVDQD